MTSQITWIRLTDVQASFGRLYFKSEEKWEIIDSSQLLKSFFVGIQHVGCVLVCPVAILTLASAIDIYLPKRNALVLETKDFFVSLVTIAKTFVKSDVLNCQLQATLDCNPTIWVIATGFNNGCYVIFEIFLQKLRRKFYYSTIMSFYHIRLRERAKYEAVIHRSVLVKPVYNRANTGGCKRSNYG